MNKIALLLSGGVDSSVALHMLCQSGEKPDCYYIHIGPDKDNTYSCTSDEDVEICKAITKHYEVNFEIIDLHKEYWDSVVKYTIDKVSHGYTPNPDVMCNTLIKFGAFYDKIGYKYDYIATGHYATRVAYANGRCKDAPSWVAPNQYLQIDHDWWIAPAKDPVKDQVDFIANIDTKKVPVSKMLFPIGMLMKDEVRKIAEENHLINAKRKDSQGICFLGKINYNEYIKQYLGELEGDIINIDTNEKIGTHKGYWFYTIGQRKGLSLSGGPWYVITKDTNKNIIYVSKTQNRANINTFFVTNINWLTKNILDEYLHKIYVEGDSDLICNIKFKIRHSPEIYTGKMKYYGNNKNVKIISNIPITIASGQFCTLYDETYEICYGCGEMISMIYS